MIKSYDIYFRRNNKEKYWRVEKGVSLYGFKDLLEVVLEKTTESKLELRIDVIKLKEAAK